MTFKQITRVILSYINLATVLTLTLLNKLFWPKVGLNMFDLVEFYFLGVEFNQIWINMLNSTKFEGIQRNSSELIVQSTNYSQL